MATSLTLTHFSGRDTTLHYRSTGVQEYRSTDTCMYACGQTPRSHPPETPPRWTGSCRPTSPPPQQCRLQQPQDSQHSTPLQHYTTTAPLQHYTTTALHQSITPPLQHYSTTPLHQSITPLHHCTTPVSHGTAHTATHHTLHIAYHTTTHCTALHYKTSSH